MHETGRERPHITRQPARVPANLVVKAICGDRGEAVCRVQQPRYPPVTVGLNLLAQPSGRPRVLADNQTRKLAG